MVDFVFILAGGSGTRLWPASLKSKPKHFIELDNGKTLLNLAIERASGLKPTQGIIIVTSKDQVEATNKCISKIKDKDIISVLPEPNARNTAPAICYAVNYAAGVSKESATALVIPADHLIEPFDLFKKNVLQAEVLAMENYLVVFGLKPTRPETGYGYIERGVKISAGYIVKSFREKPDKKKAEIFLQNKNFFWNSGMFLFKLNTFLDELKLYSNDIAASFSNFKFNRIKNEFGISIINGNKTAEEAYGKVRSVSIDYAVMEKSSKTAVVCAEFNWSDIGCWDEFSKIEIGKEAIFSIDSSDNYVYSDQPVSLIGVTDLIVISKNGRILICKKGESQKLKSIIDLIKDKNRDDLL